MSRRKSWDALTPAYRARLERQGVTEDTHATANLIRARGHEVSRPVGAIDETLYEQLMNRELDFDEFKRLARAFTWPEWVPREVTKQGGTFPVTTDVAAALSQLPNPKTWSYVEFTPRADGEPWTMTVHFKGNRHDREVLIPGGGGPGSGAKEILEIVGDLTKRPRTKYERGEALFFDVTGSD